MKELAAARRVTRLTARARAAQHDRKRPTIAPENPPCDSDLAQTTLGVLFIVTLIAASLWIMRPFLAPVIWAAMIVVATWPLMLKIEAAFGRRRWPAVAVITIAMLLVFVLPFWTAVSTIVEYSDEIVSIGPSR